MDQVVYRRDTALSEIAKRGVNCANMFADHIGVGVQFGEVDVDGQQLFPDVAKCDAKASAVITIFCQLAS
jgi:hypothetical protein